MAWLESILKDSRKAGRILALIMVVVGAGVLCYTDNLYADKWVVMTATVIGFYFSDAGKIADNK